jgi:hypothetical protein
MQFELQVIRNTAEVLESTVAIRWIPTRSATRSSKPDLNVISKLGEHGLDGCFESEALSRR